MQNDQPNCRVFSLAPSYRGDPITELSALEQSARIADGSLRSADLVDRYLARIRAQDGALSAFVTVIERRARAEAERADRLRKQGRIIGPFHGIPTAIKDHHMVRGTRTRIGSRSFDWLWTPNDNAFVARLRAAGFVIVGKTTMSELGILPIVETELQPPTRNPWNVRKTAGGSSGGAGSAVSSGMIPIAPGSDGAGSVRIPASLHGLVGLKPTRGLIPDEANKIDRWGLATNGPIARSIDDAAALLDVMCRGDRRSHLVRSRAPVGPLRIGLCLEAPVGDVDPRIASLIERAAEVLTAHGHRVVTRPRPAASLDDFMPVYQRFVSRIPVLFPQRLGRFARWFWESGKGITDERGDELMRSFEAAALESMGECDVMLTPTIGVVPFDVGQFADRDPEALFRAVAPLGAFTAIANVTGQPALSVPFGAVDGMPVGAQLIGRHDTDAQLFALGRLLERQ